MGPRAPLYLFCSRAKNISLGVDINSVVSSHGPAISIVWDSVRFVTKRIAQPSKQIPAMQYWHRAAQIAGGPGSAALLCGSASADVPSIPWGNGIVLPARTQAGIQT